MMRFPKPVRVGLYIVAFILAFNAGNAFVKWRQDNSPAAKEARAMESQYRPAFKLPDINGLMHDVNEWNGSVLVINFWATWCPPCRKEMPAFIDLNEKYHIQGLQFVGIALDDADKVKDFIDTNGVEYPILLGADEAVKVSTEYGNRLGALPYTSVINREGRIVKTYRGEVPQDALEKLILKHL